MQESIIVYRNPLEKAIWEGEYGVYFVPIFMACLATIITIVIGTRLARKIYGYTVNSTVEDIIIAIGIIAGIATGWYFWI